tara:strand:- start:2706 stop:3704 length:999 start_codon:yes stop_codon:yes gene_type:complete
MGGDAAPRIVVEGASEAKIRYPEIDFTFFGNRNKIIPIIKDFTNLDGSNIIHTDHYVKSNDKPSNIIRKGINTSMAMSIKHVKENLSDAIVSAGNTGALMAFSKLYLKTMSGINRPAIAACFPTVTGEVCMLDLGANIECDKHNLVQFALMGQAFAKIVIGVNNPKVALLNIGEEEIKGLDHIKEASNMLFKLNKIVNYYGYIEGDQITNGSVDVIVADGFTGNIALKTAEGTANFLTGSLKKSFKSSISSKIGYFFAKKALESFRSHMDPRKYNGAVFLGLNGIAVKSHGGTDSFGFANAIGVAYDMVKYNFLDELTNKLSNTTNYLEKET